MASAAAAVGSSAAAAAGPSAVAAAAVVLALGVLLGIVDSVQLILFEENEFDGCIDIVHVVLQNLSNVLEVLTPGDIGDNLFLLRFGFSLQQNTNNFERCVCV